MADGVGTALSVVNTLFAALNNPQLREILSTFSNKSDLERLKNNVTIVRNVLLDADNRNRRGVLTNTMAEFIQKLKDALYDADDLFDKYVTLTELKELLRDGSRSEKVRHFFSSKNPLIVAWSISQGVKNISKILKDNAENYSQFDEFIKYNYQPLETTRVETYSYVHTNDIIGREDDAREIIRRLLNSTDDVGFLTIVGMGGLGKTTLAKLVFNDESIKSHFGMRLWICVADQDGELDVKLILLKILELTRVKFGYESNMESLEQVYRHNLGGNKFFLVLDDVWNESTVEWQKLRAFLEMGGEGSRIIVTTRSIKTAMIIGHDIHELKGLSDDNSWRLFQMMAFREPSITPDFVEISQNIVKKCHNLPLAIMVVATLLFDQPIANWLSLLDKLDGFASKDNQTMTILKVSYDHLEPSLKSCFSYCAIFPKDYVMKKEVLMNLWEAQGYIHPFDDGQSIEDACEEHFSTLLQRSFFQDVKMNEYGDVESVKMHDLMHDLAQRVSGTEICVLINSSPLEAGSNVHHIFDCTLIKEDDFIIQSKIRSYLMFQKRWLCETENELPPFPLSKIVKKPLCLRALALQGVRVSSLPNTMGNLLHLRYLNLAKNSMKRLPDSIVNLHNLKTLNLNKCDELKEWPKGFCKLVNLKHLYRKKCYELRCMPVGMSKLTRLQVLTDFVVKDESEGGMQRVGQLKDLKALSGKLKTRLSVQFEVNFTSSKGYDWEGGCLEDARYLKEVEIGFSFPSDVLYQRRLDKERGANEEAVMEKLQPPAKIKKFTLSHYAGNAITRWGRAQDNWSKTTPYLVHIKFTNCHRLQQLPLLSKLLHLKSLYLFELKNLKYVEEEAITTNSSGSSRPRSLDTTFFPSLESLEIVELKTLKGWWRSCYSSQLAFPRLSRLTIKNCPHLTSFPPCLSHPKLDLRKINERLLRIITSDGAGSSSSFQPTHPTFP